MKKLIKTALWVVLGVMFIMAGGAKLMGSHTQVEHFAQCGGICLFIPKAQYYGIVVLSITMIGAALTHLRANEMSAFPVPIVLLCLLVMLAWTMRHPVRKN
jgi:hypothetical protein